MKQLLSAIKQAADHKPHIWQAAGNSSWLLFDRALRIAVGLLIGIWMARALGPEQFGALNYAIAFVALFTPLATLGLDGIVVRDLVVRRDSTGEVLGTVAALRSLGGVLAIALCNIAAISIIPANTNGRDLVLVISFGLIFQTADVVDHWFQSRTASKYVVLGKLPSLISIFGVRLTLVLSMAPLIAYAWTYALELLLAAIGIFATYLIHGESLRNWKLNRSQATALLREAWPLIVAGLSVMLYMKVDIVMLERMSGPTAVGIYSAATRLSEGFYFLPMIIVSSLAPALLRTRQRGREYYDQAFLSLYVLLLRLSLIIAVLMTALSSWLIEWLFGDAYAEATMILRVHIWASIAVFLGVASSQYLTLEGYQKISLYRTMLGLALNVALNLYWIPIYGALGAAMATAVSYFVATFSIVFSKHSRNHGRLMMQALSRCFYPSQP